ncbi:hypothetical protein GCM10010990_35120 [Croceicoccus mobilis]|uniref:Uncharacterized protein n=1 Tax=Croceicoccus mobilis TaxID=1703339 RepID=A0A916Z9N7_9SPHN|nr:hypothetical protein GCM10010990_35120 [Croceicoccus mobilis]
MVTSMSRTGSQKPTAMPIRGIGDPQAQIGNVGFFVSARLDGQIFNAPTDSGNMQPQQTSVIGLTKLPVHRPPVASGNV